MAREDSGYAQYTVGLIEGLLWGKHGICPACDKPVEDHSPEALLRDGIEGHGEPAAVDPLDQPDPGQVALDVPDPLSVREVAWMKEYHLEDVRDEDTRRIVNFRCSRDCGMIYKSIEDRMLRPPDECHGCMHRSAHG